MIRNSILVLAAVCMIPGCASAEGESDLRAKVETGVRSLLAAIEAHDIPRILSFVGPDGVVEDNRVVPRAEIEAQLRDEDSYLSRSLFAEPAPEEISACLEKLEGKLYVSPGAFMHAYGDNYTIKTQRIEEFRGDHYGVKVDSQGDARPGCQFELFWLRMRVVDGKVLLASSFFQ